MSRYLIMQCNIALFEVRIPQSLEAGVLLLKCHHGCGLEGFSRHVDEPV